MMVEYKLHEDSLFFSARFPELSIVPGICLGKGEMTPGKDTHWLSPNVAEYSCYQTLEGS